MTLPEPIRGTDLVLPTGEVYSLEDALEARWDAALIAFGTGNPGPLLELGHALNEARALVYRIKERCDERVRDSLTRHGLKEISAAGWQASQGAGAATFVDAAGLRAELIAAGLDPAAADRFFQLEVTNGRELRTLANRSDAYAEALAGHTKRGNSRVSYKRAAT